MSTLLRSVAVVTAGLALVACGTEPEPKPILAATPPIDTASTPAGARSAFYRNPLGHMQVRENLFADGDFELTGRSGQMPWIAFGNGGQGTLNYATGGQCYSGIRCATLIKGQAMVGYIAAPGTGSAEVSVKVKGASGKCNEANIAIVDQSEHAPNSSLFAGSPTPDGTGWCVYRGTMKNFAKFQPVLYVSAQSTTPIFVDDAIAEATSTQLATTLSAGEPPPASFVAEAHDAMVWIRAHRVFGLPRGRHVDEPPKNLLPLGTE